MSSGRHSPESGRLGEHSSGLTTAHFQSPQSPVVLQWSRREANLLSLAEPEKKRKYKKRKYKYQLNEIVIKIALSEKTS